MPTFLPTWGTKAASAAEGTSHALATYSFGWSFPYTQRWSVERAVRDGFERSIWVWRCVDAIATNGAKLPVVFRRGDPETGEIVEPRGRHDAQVSHLLNRRANPFQTARSFRYQLMCQYLLSRAGVFVEVQRNASGVPLGLYLLPPDRTAPIPDERRFVSGYRLTLSAGGFVDIDPDDVIWIRKPHPTDPYSGTIPTEAAGIDIDTDFYMRIFSRNFMIRDGRPSALIAIKGGLARGDQEELQSRFRGGADRAGEVSVIDAEALDYVDLATSPRDAQYVEGRRASKEDLLEVFGVPQSVLGNASGRTYDNADAEEEVFWRTTMDSHLRLTLEFFDGLTRGGDTDDLFLAPDYSRVNVMQRDERERATRLKAEWEAGLITADEYRDETGRDPLDVPASRVLWIASAKVPIGDEEDQDAAIELAKAVGAAEPPGGAAEPAPLPAPGGSGRADERPLAAVKALATRPDPVAIDGDRLDRSLAQPDAVTLDDVLAAVDGRRLSELMEAKVGGTRLRNALADAASGGDAVTPEMKVAAMAAVARAVPFPDVDLDDVLARLDTILRDEKAMVAATVHLRAGGAIDDLETAAMALQKAYTECAWRELDVIEIKALPASTTTPMHARRVSRDGQPVTREASWSAPWAEPQAREVVLVDDRAA